MEKVIGRIVRDNSPEARALGGWYAEIIEQSPRGPLVHSTDWHRTRHGAVIAGLALAYRLGVEMPQPTKES